MVINSETKLYGSFSMKAGNLGCKFFNDAFYTHSINAIYKSFSITNIEDAVKAARTLNFSGFAVSMPYKIDVIKYVDATSKEVDEIGAANTIIRQEDKFVAYNTDIYAAIKAILLGMALFGGKKMYILGNGGYSKAVQYAANFLNVPFEIITREKWDDILTIEKSIIYNCTPVENIATLPSNFFIDCVTTTEWGQTLSRWQAIKQFKMYTGIEYEY